jgi:hypothetical protein
MSLLRADRISFGSWGIFSSPLFKASPAFARVRATGRTGHVARDAHTTRAARAAVDPPATPGRIIAPTRVCDRNSSGFNTGCPQRASARASAPASTSKPAPCVSLTWRETGQRMTVEETRLCLPPNPLSVPARAAFAWCSPARASSATASSIARPRAPTTARRPRASASTAGANEWKDEGGRMKDEKDRAFSFSSFLLHPSSVDFIP